jgi:Na+/H+-dicarboxylate symporter
MKLQAQISIGLAAGLVIGGLARVTALAPLGDLLGWLEPVGTIFIRLITMVVVPLVAASLFTSVASLGDIRRLGRLGGRTLAYFVVTTVMAAVVGLALAVGVGVGAGLDPSVRDAIAERFAAAGSSASATVATAPGLVQTIVGMVPQNPIAAAAQGDLLPLIVAVVIFGTAATMLDERRRAPLVAFSTALNDLCMVVIRWLMVIAPPAIFVLIAVTVARSGLDLLRSLAEYAVVVVVALVLHVALVLAPALRLGARLGTGAFLRAVSDPVLLAFSTSSSSATLPVSMAAAHDRLGVSNAVTSFVLPSGTTLNKNGAAVYKAATAVFLAHIYGIPLTAGVMLTIVLTTTMASSAGAGVPGSSLVTTLIVLNAIGLGANAAAGIALVAGIDRPLDMCRTAVNTLGNLVGTAWIARAEGEAVGLVPAGAAVPAGG